LTGALERGNVICHGARLFSFPVGKGDAGGGWC
jgi:hypothetical protein